MSKRLFLVVLAVALLASACQSVPINTIRGEGNVITQQRSVSGFSAIEVNVSAELEIRQGSQESLTIQAEENLMPYINSEVRGGRLVISVPNNVSLSPTERIRLTVGVSDLTVIDVHGMNNVTASDLDLEALGINFDGSGSTTLSGTVGRQSIAIRGEATIHNADLLSSEVNVEISGAGTVEVNAADALNVTVAGLGNIRYIGSPMISQNISGTGSVTQIGP